MRNRSCEEFARQGCKVYATSRRVETIADFSHKSIEKLALDVTSDESVQNVLNFIVEKEGKIDVVVNNAGVSAPGVFGAPSEMGSIKQILIQVLSLNNLSTMSSRFLTQTPSPSSGSAKLSSRSWQSDTVVPLLTLDLSWATC
jgi:NAD(P)-dependent dehydrogenase (short-subunit alcohol dehydrogenase family)